MTDGSVFSDTAAFATPANTPDTGNVRWRYHVDRVGNGPDATLPEIDLPLGAVPAGSPKRLTDGWFVYWWEPAHPGRVPNDQ